MHWIATSDKDSGQTPLEKPLWGSADQFRANPGIKVQQDSGLILGNIFHWFAERRVALQRTKLETTSASPWRESRVEEHDIYRADGILHLEANARFVFLLSVPAGADIGAKVNDVMREIDKHNPQLTGVLPKTYNLFSITLLKEQLKALNVHARELESTIAKNAAELLGA